MLSMIRLIMIAPVMATMFVACGNEAEQRGTKNQPTVEMRESSPKLLVARVSQRDLDAHAAKIEFVAVKQDLKITNGQEAEQAFNSGTPISFNNEKAAKSLSLDQQAGSTYSVNYMPPPGQGGVPPCPVGMNCADSQVIGYGGQPIGIFGGFFQGLFMRIRNFLSLLNPFNWFGNNGVGYGYQSQYGFGNYQYATYPQMPYPYQNTQPGYGNIPVQPGYGQTPGTPGYGYGPSQPNTMPNNGGAVPQYPQNPQYPQYPQNPQVPMGNEPMPNN